MNVSLILIILLVGAFATYLLVINWLQSGSLFGLGALAATIVLLTILTGEDISVFNQWINKPQVSIALTADGLSLACYY
jgi:NADH-quinone oxidoreductase subunit M